MTNQIIQKHVDFFEEFVRTHFVLDNNVYIYNLETFKKLQYDNYLIDMIESLKQYYYKNKHYYLTRHPITFNGFNTILRQIMKKNSIDYEKKVKYLMSKYQVEYHIHESNFITVQNNDS